MNKLRDSGILKWLRPHVLENPDLLWEQADRIRRESVGESVHLRGLIEISNHCRRQCTYCGLRAPNNNLKRYSMPIEEIYECARKAYELGFGTVVLQSGEHCLMASARLAELIREIKTNFDLAVTLSLGEHSCKELRLWRQAGADRYLLRFETSDSRLYDRLHPDRPGSLSRRIKQLRTLRNLGYEIGAGVMVGLPGQTYESLEKDLELFRNLDLDMIGIGPFIPNPDTPLGKAGTDACRRPDQVPASEAMATTMLALSRIVCPEANLPATTALSALDVKSGREKALQRGANVIMPNLTPFKYASNYRIYPFKARDDSDCMADPPAILECLRACGRRPAKGPGNRSKNLP